MALYRKKPIVVEAVQFDPDIRPWPDGVRPIVYDRGLDQRPADMEGYIQTPEGMMIVQRGDWIITGIKGEKCPCKPDIFAATYELVLEST